MYVLDKQRCNSTARQSFVSARVINVWNNLPDSTDFRCLRSFNRSVSSVYLSKYCKVIFVTQENSQAHLYHCLYTFVSACFVSFCVRRSQPQHYCFYVLLVLQPVRGQSALGWFINNTQVTRKICTVYSVQTLMDLQLHSLCVEYYVVLLFLYLPYSFYGAL